MKCIPLAIYASKQPKLNSVIIAEVTKASQEQKQRLWENMDLPGEDLPVAPVDTPLTTAQLADIMTAFKGLCKAHGELNLDIHNLKSRSRRDRWIEIGFRNIASNRIRRKVRQHRHQANK